MPRNYDDDPKFRLRPGKPPIPRERRSSPGISVAFRAVLKYARSSRASRRPQVTRSKPAHLQHCAVRMSYSTNRVKGLWRAHGRYIARESASLEPEHAGFSAAETRVDTASKLHEWQDASDPRMWKLIISPEFGERLDLETLTRDVMNRMEADLHTTLEWVAVAHFNTEHPHVHVALRGVNGDGVPFKLERDYVRNGLRSVAQHFATVQIGHRTEQDSALALSRQVPQQRFTPLDRLIIIRGETTGVGPDSFTVAADPTRSGLGRFAAVREQSLAARLMALETMGLAHAHGAHQWQVRSDLETALKAMQRAADHQKTLASHSAVLSDRRLQLSAPSWRDVTSLEGRVLSHGEEENGNRYLLLEGTDARVYYLRYTEELEEARGRGELTTNSFIVIRKTFDENRRRRISVANLGGAELLLGDETHFRTTANRLLQRGVLALDDERWKGWLGKYHEKLQGAMLNPETAPISKQARSIILER